MLSPVIKRKSFYIGRTFEKVTESVTWQLFVTCVCDLCGQIRSFSRKQFRFHEFEDLSVRNTLPLVHEKSVLKQWTRREHLGVNVQRYTLGMKPEG